MTGLLFPLACALVAAAPAPEPASDGRHHVLVLDLEPSGGLSDDEMRLLNGLVVQGLAGFSSLQVLSAGDIRQMVSLEAEKQATGCDTSSCLAEIAGAMGAQYVVYGQAGRLGDRILVQLNLFDSATAQSIAREKVQVGDVGALTDVIDPAVARLASALPGVAAAPVVALDEPSVLPWAMLGGGALAGVGGAATAVVGVVPLLLHAGVQGQIDELAQQGTLQSATDARALHDEAAVHNQSWKDWGALSVVAGSALLVVGAAVAGAGGFLAFSQEAE